MSSLTGHPSTWKTLKLLHLNVCWLKMSSTVAQFCKQCGTCALTKNSTQYAHWALQLLPVLPVWSHSYTLEFVTDLPPAWVFNCILIVIDCFTKLRHLIPYTKGEDKLSAVQVAKLLFENIPRFFLVPKEIVHGRDPRFTTHLWHELWRILGTKTSATIVFHPQSDRQSERTNRTFKQILSAHMCNKP